MKSKLNLFLAAIFLVLGVTTANAQYLYNTAYTVTNNENKIVTRWQLAIYVNTAAEVTAGHMQADGRDIRFSKDCAGTQLLNHFIDSGMNSTKTKIWVMVDTLYPLADRTIYMLYGNSTVSSTSTFATFNGPYTGTDGVTPPSTNTVSNCQRSMKFSAKRQILISGFGKRTPNGTTRWVTLFNFSTQVKVAQMQVSGAAGTYSFQDLPNHMWIEPNVDYVLALFNGSGDMYYYGASGQSSQYINYGDMRYCNSCTQNTFPTSTLTNNMYGVPDFEYYTADTNNITNVPTYSKSSSGSGNAELTLGAMPYVCPGTTIAEVPYLSSAGNPKEYDIVWGTTAANAGFTDVSKANFPPSPINVSVPASAPFGSYTGTITPRNVCGPGQSYTITINVGGTISTNQQPKDTTVCPRDPSGFEVEATGPTLSFQWQVLVGSVWTDLSNGGDYANVNTPKLSILKSQNAYDGNKYRCMVNSTCTPSVSSSPGKLIVRVDPEVSTPPADVSVAPGANVYFRIKATGSAKYQWQVAEPNGVFVNINDGPIYDGVKTPSLLVRKVSYVQNNFRFRCMLFNVGVCISPGDTSSEALLTVSPPQSVNNITSQEMVVIYPNPTDGTEMNIKADNLGMKDLTYNMYDKLGRVVRTGTLDNTGATKVDIANLASSVYVVEILDAEQQKISKQKFTKL